MPLLCLPAALRAKAFVCLRQPSHLSLSGQRNVAQREATPLPRLADILSARFASRGRAFRQHIHVLAKRHRHPCRCPLRGLSTPPRRCRGAPGRATRILRVLFRRAGSRAELRQPGAFAFQLHHRVRAGSALLYPGPLWRGGWAEERPRRGGRQGCRPVRRQSRDGLSANPRSPPAHLEGRMPGRRAIGVAFSLGYFSLGHTREK